MIDRAAGDVRHRRSHALVGGTCSFESPAAIAILDDSMQARIQLDGGELSGWLHVCEGLGQECVSSSLSSNIFGAAWVDVISLRLGEDPAIVPTLEYLRCAEK